MIMMHCYLYFLIYSFLGWVYESLFYSVQLKKPVNTGFLRGCLCPIYGVICVFNILMLDSVTNNTHVFLISMITVSAVEYVVSYILEMIFNKRWWDYSNWPCNINGRVSLISSLAFGIMSVLQLRVLHPFISAFVESRSERMLSAFVIAATVGGIADLVWTIRMMDKASERLWFLDEDMGVPQYINKRVGSSIKRISSVREYIHNRFIK